MKNLLKRIIYRFKNLPPVLPLYFKLKNRNLNFFTDYYDQYGEVARGEGYYGQRGQDKFAHQKYFKNIKDGFFLDIGANDPKELSNTLFFEELGWSGLAFEPQDKCRVLWKEQRKTKCLPNLLGELDGEVVTFLEYQTDQWQHALSGVEGYVNEEVSTLENVPVVKKQLEKTRLATLLEEYNVKHVDFISLDVEGFELDVLKGIDFENVTFNIIVVENDRSHLGDSEIRNFLKARGFVHVARLSGDDVFQALVN